MWRRELFGLALLFAVVGPSFAFCSNLIVLSGSGVQFIMNGILSQFQQKSGHRVSTVYGTVGEMADRVQQGEVADLVIASGPQIERLEKLREVVPGSRTDLGKTGVGLFVRKGASKPDISSVEAFKRAMLDAKSIGWNDPAAGAPVSIYMLGAFELMGIGSEMKDKTVAFRQRSERFEAVARGDVEIGFNQLSEIVAASGIDLVGPLPAPIQHYTVFADGIVASSANQEASKALLAFIASPAAKATMYSNGFETP
jgi:molybdate transport system substrate-binding protein